MLTWHMASQASGLYNHMSHVIIVAIFKCAMSEGKLVKRHMHKLDFRNLLELLSPARERISLEVFKLVLEFYIS